MHHCSLLEVLLQLVWALRGNEGQDLEHQEKRGISCHLWCKRPKHPQNRRAREQWLCGKCRALQSDAKQLEKEPRQTGRPDCSSQGKGRKEKWIRAVILNIISHASVASVVRKVKDSAIKQLVCHIRMMLSSLEAGGLVDLVSRKMFKLRISLRLLFCVCIG